VRPRPISPRKGQSMVNQAYLNRVNDALLGTSGAWPDARPSAGDALHPGCAGIDRQRRRSESDTVRHPAIRLMQPLGPGATQQEARQGDGAELQQCQRQRTAEDRAVERVFQQVTEAAPKGRGGCELGVATTDPAA